MYLAIAYRWGNPEAHHYFLYCGPVEQAAINAAQAEQTDRGGKYNAVVYQFDTDGYDYKQIAYFPAMTEEEGATGMKHNWRADMLCSLGIQMESAALGGKVMLPNPNDTADGPKTLTFQKVEVPQWIKDDVARQRDQYDKIRKAFNGPNNNDQDGVQPVVPAAEAQAPEEGAG